MSAIDSLSPCRLLVDGPADGAWNMAVDEVLLAGAAEQNGTSLRFYAWSEPTLSLGYFQNAADRTQHAASRGCPIVRRQTGGGAILHDSELTYCLAVPYAHPLAADARRLYRAVHDALVGTLEQLGIAATLHAASEEIGTLSPPFLCFQRRTCGDVLLGTSKVCGSAQRRRRGAILQHGSLLLATSPHAPELPGIRQLTPTNPEWGPLARSWGQAIGRHLRLAPAAGQLSDGERQAARILSMQKYATPLWNQRR